MGKKTVLCLLIIAMAVSLCCLPSLLASAAVEGDWQYTLYDGDTTAAITGYTGIDTDITIPSTIAGKPVTRIGSNAFVDKTTIHSVIIPDSVLRIESGAFQNSTLTAVDLGEGVTYIGQHAFYSTELATVTIPSSLETIDKYAFADCTSLANINN